MDQLLFTLAALLPFLLVGMAQTITAPAFAHIITPPGNDTKLADQTATTADFVPAFPCKFVFALVNMKAFTGGTGTVPPTFFIDGADDSGFTTNVRKIGQPMGERAANNAILIGGEFPDGAKAHLRIRLVLSGTDTCTFDAALYGCP